MLRNMLFVIAMIMICSITYASDTDWSWSFGQGYTANFGTVASALDDVDSHDVQIINKQYYYYGAYHEHNVGGWTGDTGFYSTDIYAPLQLTPGRSKTWTFYLWADLSYPQGPSGDHLELMWGFGPATPAFSKMQYVLTYVRSAQGSTSGTLPVGTSVVLNQDGQGTWSFPVFRTTDGRTGYMFSLTATVIPEPSSLAALALGLAPLAAGGLKKRRRR